MPCYASPFTQLIIVSMVCFFCPGMFNALSGMGGGGQVSANAADKANVALYSTFCKFERDVCVCVCVCVEICWVRGFVLW